MKIASAGARILDQLDDLDGHFRQRRDVADATYRGARDGTRFDVRPMLHWSPSPD